MYTRLGEFELTLHPEKTRLIEFGRRAAVAREKRGLGRPETFNFLGYTLICGKSRWAASSSRGRLGETA
jgi:RNA-directed DNA polymerase